MKTEENLEARLQFYRDKSDNLDKEMLKVRNISWIIDSLLRNEMRSDQSNTHIYECIWMLNDYMANAAADALKED